MTSSMLIKKMAQTDNPSNQYRLLENAIKRKYRNLELIGFLDELTRNVKEHAQRLLMVKWAKRIVLGTRREPDPMHFAAYREAYLTEFCEMREEQKEHDPVKWLEHEEHLLSLQTEDGNMPMIAPVLELENPKDNDIYTTKKKLLTAKEVMELLGISKTSLDRRRANGLRSIKDGRKVYFKTEEVIRYIEKGRR